MYYNSKSTLGEAVTETGQSAPVKKNMSALGQETPAASTQASGNSSSTVATGSEQSNSTGGPGADVASAGVKINYAPFIALGGIIAVATALYFIFN